MTEESVFILLNEFTAVVSNLFIKKKISLAMC